MKALIFVLFFLASCTTQNLEVGSENSDFSLLNQDEELISIAEEISKNGSKGVVLFFYPKDGTSLCTEQVQLINKSLLEFAKSNYLVYGVSKDSPKSHKKFSMDYNLRFPLLSDEEGKIHASLKIGTFFGMASRTTLILDKDLKLEHPPFVSHVSAKKHIEYAISKISSSTN